MFSVLTFNPSHSAQSHPEYLPKLPCFMTHTHTRSSSIQKKVHGSSGRRAPKPACCAAESRALLQLIGSLSEKRNFNHTHTHTRGPSPSSTSRAQLRPMTVRVVHSLQHHTLSSANRNASKLKTCCAVRLARTHTQNKIDNCSASSPPYHGRGATVAPNSLPRGTSGTLHVTAARGPSAATQAPCRPCSPSPPQYQLLPSDLPAPRRSTAHHRGCPSSAACPMRAQTRDCSAAL